MSTPNSHKGHIGMANSMNETIQREGDRMREKERRRLKCGYSGFRESHTEVPKKDGNPDPYPLCLKCPCEI